MKQASLCWIGGKCHHKSTVTCKYCAVPMKELKGHIYHKKRKWQCPKCSRVRMQMPKPVRNLQ